MQSVAAADKVDQCPSAVPGSVCQPDPKTVQQHIEKGAVTSGRGKGKISGKTVLLSLHGTSTTYKYTIQFYCFTSHSFMKSNMTLQLLFQFTERLMVSFVVLGPLLFLIYINDLPNFSSKFNFHLFAHDTNMLCADTNVRSLEATVNVELINLCEWQTANKQTLNAKKSNFVIFRPRQKELDHNVNLNGINNDTNALTPLECKEYVKYLGVLIIIDSHLSWKFHVDYVTSKLSKIRVTLVRLLESLHA